MYNIAVAGATGAVGREMLQTLAERAFPANRVHALASKGSVGREISYGEDRELTVEALDSFDFSSVDIEIGVFRILGISHQRITVISRNNNGQNAVLEAVVIEDISKTGRDHRTDTVIKQRPWRMLTA